MTDAYTITVPIISTKHIPGQEVFALMMSRQPCAKDDCHYLCFVHLEEVDDTLPWLYPIAEWALEKHKTFWVMFEVDGDVIEELPAYKAEWEEQ